jgi:tetratricopeptide (TPR) repeat protein
LPTTWTAEGFVDHFGSVNRRMDDRRFCFVLGAGASRASGIPVASELVRKWLQELQRRRAPEVAHEAWLASGDVEIEGFDPADPARFYPHVYALRFRDDPEDGFAWLEEAMRRARPSFGYFVLARILAETRHRIVLTTNFDNLVAEALLQATGVHPVVCGHESLAPFARVLPRRPLVAKIHRDLLLAPVSDPDGVDRLALPWHDPLTRILMLNTPVFLGYGGNDGSLMGFLEGLAPGTIPGQPVWCYWEREAPAPRVVALMERHRGVMVPIRDFDSLMMGLNHALGFDLPLGQLEARAREQIEWYRAEVERMVRPGPAAVAAAGSVERTDGPWQVQLRAAMTSDADAQRKIYVEGLRRFPDSAELAAAWSAWLRDVGGDPAAALVEARRALGMDPHLGAAALAEARALAELGYAAAAGGHDTEAMQRHADADDAFQRAARLDARRPATLQAWANHLTDACAEHDRAEALYQEAASSSGRKDPGILCDYGVFLSDVRRDEAAAEALHREALALEGDNPSFLSNHAEVLLRLRRWGEAEEAAARLWAVAAADPARRRVAAVLGGLAARCGAKDDARWLGRLRALLPADRPSRYGFGHVLGMVGPLLPAEGAALYGAVIAALERPERAEGLAVVPGWLAISPAAEAKDADDGAAGDDGVRWAGGR